MVWGFGVAKFKKALSKLCMLDYPCDILASLQLGFNISPKGYQDALRQATTKDIKRICRQLISEKEKK